MSELETAQAMDEKDPLAKYRNDFVLNPNEIYMDGNSLGKLPKKAQKDVQNTVENQWGKRLIRSWNEVWMDLPLRLAENMQRFFMSQKKSFLLENLPLCVCTKCFMPL